MRLLTRLLPFVSLLIAAACARSTAGPSTPRTTPSAPDAASATPMPAAPATSAPTPASSVANQSESLVAVAAMSQPRACHTLTLLPNGQVLVAGGLSASGNTDSAELFDPASGQFRPTGHMTRPRACHTATLLADGRVLIVGGLNGGYEASAELYDPASGAFTETGPLTVARADHVAARLTDGRVLLAGGIGTGYTFLDSAELYDPASGRFSPTGSMTVPREAHIAIRLLDGRVFIVGGHRGRHAAIVIYASAELYDPITGTFAATGSMATPRHKHDAALLPDGRVLVAGGSDQRDDQGQYRSAEIYDPLAGQFSPAPDMLSSRYKFPGTSVPLADGRVLLAGGAARPEIFDPRADTFLPVSGQLDVARLFAGAVRLASGQVLITGGYGPGRPETQRAWLFTP